MKSLSTFTLFLVFILFISLRACTESGGNEFLQTEIFSLVSDHTHGSTIVELPGGDLLAAWFQGSGERWADDVQILGARLASGETTWSEPFLMADVPEFPDINPVLFLDPEERLWLVWYTVMANQWETSLPVYRISEDYMQKSGPPNWKWQQTLFVKPGDRTERGILPGDRFVRSVEMQAEAYGESLREALSEDDPLLDRLEQWKESLIYKAGGQDMIARGYYTNEDGERVNGQMGYPRFRRLGWQTKNKAIFLEGGRMILPLYSDGFSFSLMAITDDGGANWHYSEPLVAPGNIQASLAVKKNGALVAYMRDNGPPPKRLMVSESNDRGESWALVSDSELPNEGSGADVVTLQNGHWVLAWNDTEEGRHSLAISVSEDEGISWPFTRHLELDERDPEKATQFSYPSIIEGKDGAIHVVYSYHSRVAGGEPGKTIKYARINEAWIKEGDQ